MLSERYSSDDLRGSLQERAKFKPFATARERECWNALDVQAQEEMISRGEKYLGFTWPALSAGGYMEFSRTGNRMKYHDPYFQRRDALGSLVVAECIEYKGRFLEDIINGIWYISEETAWNVPAHNDNMPLPNLSNPVIDLYAAETGALFSWIHFLLKLELDAVSPLICERMEIEVQRRILEPYQNRNDFWWMGYAERSVNNWNPWCHSNCIAAILFMETKEENRLKAVEKCLKSVDKFLEIYHDDGGCDEGTSYWGQAGASLFDLLELLYIASGGTINYYDHSLIHNIGKFICRSHISKEYFINFADGGAKVNLSSELVFRYGCRIGDEKLAAQGVYNFQLNNCNLIDIKWFPMFRVLCNLMNYKQIKEKRVQPPLLRDVWLDGIEVMAARDREGCDQGLYLAAKGGHNAENHNHNDVGQFIVYSDGNPAIIDIGVETYTGKTFSSQRYEIWTMQSAYHNLPTVNGLQQQAGKVYKASNVAYECSESAAMFSMNIENAYPVKAGIQKWKRTLRFIRQEKAYIEIDDAYVLEQPSEDVMLSLMVAGEPRCTGSNAALLPVCGGRNIIMEYPAETMFSFERISIQDTNLRNFWGEYLYRIKLKAAAVTDHGRWILRFSQE